MIGSPPPRRDLEPAAPDVGTPGCPSGCLMNAHSASRSRAASDLAHRAVLQVLTVTVLLGGKLAVGLRGQ